jgi:hypothetical protein
MRSQINLIRAAADPRSRRSGDPPPGIDFTAELAELQEDQQLQAPATPLVALGSVGDQQVDCSCRQQITARIRRRRSSCR